MPAKVVLRTGNYSSESPLIAGAGERDRRQARKKWELLVRNLSLATVNFSLIGFYVVFRSSKLNHHIGFHSIWLAILLFIAHLAVTVILRMRRPFRPLGLFSGVILKSITDLLTVFFTGLLTSQVTRSRPQYFSPSPGVDYFLFNCTGPLGVSSLPELSSTGEQILVPSSFLATLNPNANPNANLLDLILAGCSQPILVPPSSLQTLITEPNPNANPNLLDWQIVVALALVALYSLAMATLLRPGLSFTLTPLSLYISFFFFFALHADSEFPRFSFFGALSIYSILLIGIKNYIEYRAEDAPDTQTLAQRASVRTTVLRAQRQLQGEMFCKQCMSVKGWEMMIPLAFFGLCIWRADRLQIRNETLGNGVGDIPS